MSFAQRISAVSKSCFHNIRDLRRIRNRPTIDQTTACTIAISLIHSKIDYCNSLLLNLPATLLIKLLPALLLVLSITLKLTIIVALLPPLFLKLQTGLLFILLLFCGTVCRLIYVILHITPLLRLIKTHLSLMFQSHFFL